MKRERMNLRVDIEVLAATQMMAEKFDCTMTDIVQKSVLEFSEKNGLDMPRPKVKKPRRPIIKLLPSEIEVRKLRGDLRKGMGAIVLLAKKQNPVEQVELRKMRDWLASSVNKINILLTKGVKE